MMVDAWVDAWVDEWVGAWVGWFARSPQLNLPAWELVGVFAPARFLAQVPAWD